MFLCCFYDITFNKIKAQRLALWGNVSYHLFDKASGAHGSWLDGRFQRGIIGSFNWTQSQQLHTRPRIITFLEWICQFASTSKRKGGKCCWRGRNGHISSKVKIESCRHLNNIESSGRQRHAGLARPFSIRSVNLVQTQWPWSLSCVETHLNDLSCDPLLSSGCHAAWPCTGASQKSDTVLVLKDVKWIKSWGPALMINILMHPDVELQPSFDAPSFA